MKYELNMSEFDPITPPLKEGRGRSWGLEPQSDADTAVEAL